METKPVVGPVVRTVEIGGSALSQALQRQDTSPVWVRQLRGADAWSAQIASVQQHFAGVDWLSPLQPAFAATGLAGERLQRAVTHGVVVTTGQQPGLFGGPAYTWSKAIAALALANELEATLGVPVAPVFWAATDDADWREAAVTHIVGENGLETLTLDGVPTESIAMAEVPLGDVTVALSRLRSASGSAANSSYLELVESAYVAHATVGEAYVHLLRGVLEPLGIAVLDASHSSLRNAADPILRKALQQAATVDDALQRRNAEIVAAGFSPQVESVKGLTQVFRTTRTARGNTRERVAISEATRVFREAQAGTLGSNVLLRPVLERALLPTVAYMAGPGEYAYFAQVEPIAVALQLAPPLAVPRWAAAVIDPHITRLLDRLGVKESDFDDPHAVESRLARSAMNDGVADALERARLATATQMRALQLAVTDADDLVSASVVDGASRDIAHRLERLERRIVAGVKRREQSLVRDIKVARASVRPLGKPPERVLNLIPALARHGPRLLELMLESARHYAKGLVQGVEANAL